MMTQSTTIHRRRRTLAIGALLATLCLLLSTFIDTAAAHPLGNFTMNRYSRLEFSSDGVNITYVLDFAEIPTLQEMKFLDTDGDGQLSDAEANAYLDERMPVLLKGLKLVVGDQIVPLSVV